MSLNATQVWRLVTHHLAFLTSSELVLGGLLLYSFRLFERRYGTPKFAAFVVSVSALGTLFQVAILTLAAPLGLGITTAAPGPYVVTRERRSRSCS